MKTAAILCLLLFFSCRYDVNEVKKPSPEKCVFNIGESNFRRPPIDRKKKPRNPPAPEPPPNIIQGVLFLDFDGELVSGTSWNYNGDINAEHSGLTLEQQQTILDSVAYDFRMCSNVRVSASEMEYNLAPADHRQRVIITQSWQWYGQVGGVAFLGSYHWGNTPCFVFSSLLYFHVKNITDAVTHEAGHTLKLYHQSEWADGIKTKVYKDGVIMGRPYTSYNAQWILGTNSNGQVQNDTAVIKVQ